MRAFLQFLGVLACAAVHVFAKDKLASAASGLKRRQPHLEPALTVEGVSDPRTEVGSLLTERASPDRLLLKLDASSRAQHGRRHEDETQPKQPLKAITNHRERTYNSFDIEPRFFQMESTFQFEHQHQHGNQTNISQPSHPVTNISQPSHPVNATSSFASSTISEGSEDIGPWVEVKDEPSVLETLEMVEDALGPGPDNIGGLSRVKDLNDRTINRPDSLMRGRKPAAFLQGKVSASSGSGLLGWLKDLVSVGGSSKPEELEEVDSLVDSEAEANYSMQTEGTWLFACLAGLIFFSCIFALVAKFSCNSCAAARNPSTFSTTSSEPDGFTGRMTDSFTSSERQAAYMADVLNAEAVINSARAQEEHAMDEQLFDTF